MAVLVFSGVALKSAAGQVSPSPQTGDVTTSNVVYMGTSSLSGGSPSSQSASTDSNYNPVIAPEPAAPGAAAEGPTPPGLSSLQAPNVPPSSVQTASGKDFSGFNGLSALDSTNANGGLTVTPPDQGLCASSKYVMEPINIALTVYSYSGTELTAPVSLYSLFNIPPYPTNFPIGDVRCLYDASSGHWFITQLDVNYTLLTNGNGKSWIAIAVSVTDNPLGSYYIYMVPTTDNGTAGTPHHKGCPCLGDQPTLGADANGLYITTNEYGTGPLLTSFNGAQIYAIDKAELESGVAATFVHINAGPALVPYGGVSYSLQPSMNSPGQPFATNTEYFLSALDFSTNFDNRIALWALTGTDTLGTARPHFALDLSIIKSEVYGQPTGWDNFLGFVVPQQDGPRPLAKYLAKMVNPDNNILEQLAGDDARMQMVTYADGNLWSSLETTVQVLGTTEVGIAYFVVSPSLSSGGVSGTITEQGYIAARGADLIYPSIGVNNNGVGAVSFSISGPNMWPSAAYSTISISSGTGPIKITAAGTAPLDDFSGYPAYLGNGVARYGDYSWAVAAPNGNIWIAAEYIPPGPRGMGTNYGSFISYITTS